MFLVEVVVMSSVVQNVAFLLPSIKKMVCSNVITAIMWRKCLTLVQNAAQRIS